jgi:hypothetical protein
MRICRRRTTVGAAPKLRVSSPDGGPSKRAPGAPAGGPGPRARRGHMPTARMSPYPAVTMIP